MKKFILITSMVSILAVTITAQDIKPIGNYLVDKKETVIQSLQTFKNSLSTDKADKKEEVIYEEMAFKKEFKTNNNANLRIKPLLEADIISEIPNKVRVSSIKKTTINNHNWYFINYNGQEGWISEGYIEEYVEIKKEVSIKTPVINQLPELPRGCEVTSLAMMLNHAGVKVNKMTLANEVKKDTTPFSIKNGTKYFGNPYNGFVGDMYTWNNQGYGVYHGPIRELADKYLTGRIVDFTGQDFNKVYEFLNKGKPVWIIINSWYKTLPEDQWIYWETNSGAVKVTKREHSVLITGYDEHYIYFNDPLTNQQNRKVNKADFINAWKQMGSQAISYE